LTASGKPYIYPVLVEEVEEHYPYRLRTWFIISFDEGGRPSSIEYPLHRERPDRTLRRITMLLRELVLSLSLSWQLLLISHAATMSGTATTTSADWVHSCRTAGFDPDQLACSTCEVLKQHGAAIHDYSKCQECCQSWYDTKRIHKPYEAAALIIRGPPNDEVSNLLNDDWDAIVGAKGRSRVWHVQVGGGAESQGGSLFSVRSSHQLLLFDTQIVSNTQDLMLLNKQAVEKYNLDGLSREDMKDMLLTLLP
jgi:hypothetical protein